MHTLRIREIVLVASLFVLLVLVYVIPNTSVVNFLTKTPSTIKEYFVQKDELSKLPSFQVSGQKIVPTWDKTMNEPVWKGNSGEVVGVLEKELKQPMRVSTRGKLTILTDNVYRKYFDIDDISEVEIEECMSRFAELSNVPQNSYDSLVIVYSTMDHMNEVRDKYEALIQKNNFKFTNGEVKEQEVLRARLYNDSGSSYGIVGDVKNTPRTIRIIIAGNGEMFDYPHEFLFSSLIGSLPVSDIEKPISSDKELYECTKKITINVR